MKDIMPYIASIVSALIATLSSIFISRRETKTEIEKLIKQHEFDLETEREQHKHELEKQDLEHKHQLDLIKIEAENKVESDVINTVITEAMKLPETRKQMSQVMRNSKKKK